MAPIREGRRGPASDVGRLVAPSYLRNAAPFRPPRDNLFVQLYEASAGETLEGMELFRVRWLFQLGVVDQGWKAYGIEPWSSGRRCRTSCPGLSPSSDGCRRGAETSQETAVEAGRHPFRRPEEERHDR
jgi:hypothetical protein